MTFYSRYSNYSKINIQIFFSKLPFVFFFQILHDIIQKLYLLFHLLVCCIINLFFLLVIFAWGAGITDCSCLGTISCLAMLVILVIKLLLFPTCLPAAVTARGIATLLPIIRDMTWSDSPLPSLAKWRITRWILSSCCCCNITMRLSPSRRTCCKV